MGEKGQNAQVQIELGGPGGNRTPDALLRTKRLIRFNTPAISGRHLQFPGVLAGSAGKVPHVVPQLRQVEL